MFYQLFEQAIVIIKKPKPDQKALHKVTDSIVHEFVSKDASEASLKLFSFLFFKTKRNHKSISFFSNETAKYLMVGFEKDPSNLTSTFIHSLAIYEQSSNVYFLEKLTYSAWRFKKIAVEVVRECKVYG